MCNYIRIECIESISNYSYSKLSFIKLEVEILELCIDITRSIALINYLDSILLRSIPLTIIDTDVNTNRKLQLNLILGKSK